MFKTKIKILTNQINESMNQSVNQSVVPGGPQQWSRPGRLR